MSVCLLWIEDNRPEYHDQAWNSAKRLLPRVDEVVQVHDPDHSKGFAGAIEEGWERVLATGCDYVFHLEADFTFSSPVNLHGMISLLELQPQLAQVALKRQPVNSEECAAGGIVECHPEDFDERTDEHFTWTEHRRFWTTNPSVYSTRWCKLGWPQESESEGKFTHKLLADPLLRFAFWGGKFDPPLVEHIGQVRSGVGY